MAAHNRCSPTRSLVELNRITSTYYTRLQFRHLQLNLFGIYVREANTGVFVDATCVQKVRGENKHEAWGSIGMHFWSHLESLSESSRTKARDHATVGVSGLVVRVSTRNFQVAGSNLTAGHLQATLSTLLTYGMLR